MDESRRMIEEKSNNKLPAGESDDVTAEVLPSVDSDKNSSDWNLPAKLRENVQKRKRPRRKSKKRKYPYAKTSWQQRRELRNSERALRVRQQMFANGQPVAPYNTTQFLIEDHGDLQNIDDQLQVAQDHIPGGSIFNNKPSRARDSSFSVDSDEDYFYSSPEDEEEFLTKEFSNAYEDLHVERLSSMSKSEIIHDYLQLESKYEKTIIELKRLKKGIKEEEDEEMSSKDDQGVSQKVEEQDTDASSKSECSNELAEQLRLSQLENKSLKVELEELQKENKSLLNLIEKNQSSSVDSESDSSSTSSMSSDSSSCNGGGESDKESKNSVNQRTQNMNQTDSNNSTQPSYSNMNGITNGNLSEVEMSDNEKHEAYK